LLSFSTGVGFSPREGRAWLAEFVLSCLLYPSCLLRASLAACMRGLLGNAGFFLAFLKRVLAIFVSKTFWLFVGCSDLLIELCLVSPSGNWLSS
jgi:hypothetical protein